MQRFVLHHFLMFKHEISSVMLFNERIKLKCSNFEIEVYRVEILDRHGFMMQDYYPRKKIPMKFNFYILSQFCNGLEYIFYP